MPDEPQSIVERSMQLHHVRGVPWHEAPLPRRWHHCRAQTTGFLDGVYVSRCACGAMSLDGGPWMEKNQTRKYRRRSRR
jgi:hypothetical protein